VKRASLRWALVLAGLAFLAWAASRRPSPPSSIPRAQLPRGWSVDHATAPQFLRPREILRDSVEQDPISRRLLAAGLRAKARSSPAAFDQLLTDLADAASPMRYRELVALVLGSLDDPRAQAALLQALQSSRDDGWSATLLHALGAAKGSGEDDEIFDFPDSPFVYEISGLRLEIRTELASSTARAIVSAFLDQGGPELRRAAARTLLHSTAHADVRGRFGELLDREGDDGLRSGYAHALASWAARQPGTSREREAIVARILDIGLGREDAAVRFRSEGPLGSAALTAVELGRLAGAAGVPPMERQLWSLSILSRQTATHPGDVEAACLQAAAPACPDKVRESAARTLGSIRTSTSDAALIGMLSDAAWNVRLTAARSLKGRPGAGTALAQAASADADARVREAARESLNR
jgi:hypothetical protein